MPQMIDEAGNIWEVGADGKPVYVGPANRGGGPNVQILGGPDPYKVKSDARDDTRLNLAVEAARRANENSEASNSLAERRFQYQQQQDSIKPKTKAMRQGDGDKLEAEVSQYASLTDALASFNPEFGGNTITGGAENTLQSLYAGFGTPGQRDWWANFANTDNIIRNGLYGASLTAGEKAAYDATTVNPRMAPDQIKANLARRADIVQAALGRKVNRFRAAGFNADEIDATIGLYGDDFTPQALEQNRFFNPNAPRDAETRRLVQQDDQQPVAGAFGAQNPPTGGGGPVGGGGLTPEQMGGLNRQAALQGALSRDQGVVAGDPNATDTAIPVPPEMQNKLIAYVMKNRQTIKPEQLDAYVRQLSAEYSYPAQAGNSVDVVNAVRKGAPYQGIQPSRRQMSGVEQFQNKVIQNPLGTAAAGYLNAGGFGIPQMLSPDEYRAMQNVNPLSSLGGEVGGAITGTSLIGRAAGAGAAKVAPRLLGGGKGAQFARNLGTDAAYGAAYGGTTQGDPLSGALFGAAGSAAGQGVASAVGRAATPVIAPVAKRLADQGITMSPGQVLRDRGGYSGAVIGGIEDRLSGLPVIGDMVNGIRGRGIEDMNLTGFNSPNIKAIGGKVDAVSYDGLAQMENSVNSQYGNSVKPMRLSVDQDIMDSFDALAERAARLDPTVGTETLAALKQTGSSLLNGPVVTGEMFQGAKQGLNEQISALPRGTFGGQAKSVLKDARQSLFDMAGRQDPVNFANYRLADAANGDLEIMRSAVNAAKSRPGNPGLATPAQLAQAAAKGEKYNGRGFHSKLAEDAVKLLPSQVPDSGTAGRLLLGGTALGAGGASERGWIDPTTGMAIAAPALLYTKPGQKLMMKALLGERPAAIAKVGRAIRKKKGLFGHAAAPLAIENSGQ